MRCKIQDNPLDRRQDMKYKALQLTSLVVALSSITSPRAEVASEANNGTLLEFYYAVGGYSAGGLDQLAPLVDQVLSEQLGRLKTHLETGSPSPQ